LQTLALARDGESSRAAGYVVLSVALSLGAVAVGFGAVAAGLALITPLR
jgi:fluoride ion exporter CrcB/FEX